MLEDENTAKKNAQLKALQQENQRIAQAKRDREAAAALLEAKLQTEMQKVAAEKEAQIQSLKAQLDAWDKVVAKKTAENPAFKKVMDSQRAFAARAGQWQNDYMVDFKMAYNHYFSKKS